MGLSIDSRRKRGLEMTSIADSSPDAIQHPCPSGDHDELAPGPRTGGIPARISSLCVSVSTDTATHIHEPILAMLTNMTRRKTSNGPDE